MPLYTEFVPTPRQAEFLKNPSMYKLYGGSMGSGKSCVLCAEGIRLAITYPKNVVLICRHEFKSFKQSTMIELEEMLPINWIKSRNKTDGEFELINGSIILTTGLENVNKIKSYNLGAVLIDEATDTTLEMFNMLSTRLRLKSVPDNRRFMLLASNPEPGWVKDKFVDPQMLGHPLPNHAFIQALPQDNPHLPADYVSRLRQQLPPLWVSKYLEGSWDVYDAQIFKPDYIHKSNPLPSSFEEIFIAVDPAITESEDEDFDETSITVLGVDRNNIIHEIETRHGRWGIHGIIQNCDELYRYHKPSFFGVEIIAFQKALVQLLQEKNINAIPIKRDGDKIRRAYAVSHLFEENRVRVNNDILIKQMLEFPHAKKNGGHDDMVDSMVLALQLYKKYSTEIKPEIVNTSTIDQNSKLIWDDFKKFKTKKSEDDELMDFLYGG